MLYSLDEIVVIGVIMTCGSLVQGAVGFASGLICVPLLVLCSFSLPEAATINLVSTSLQNITGATKLWSHLEPRELVFPIAVRWLFIPLGVYAAWHADHHLSPERSKQLIGLVLLGILMLVWIGRAEPRERLSRWWQSLAFSTSGFLQGFASIGGAPLVLYVNSLTWTANKSRAFLFTCAASGVPIAAIAFWAQHGERILPAASAALITIPVVLTGLALGMKAGARLQKSMFQRITYGLLTLIAISAIVWPLISDL